MAVSTYGATSDVAARMMMKHGGVDPEKELKIIQLGAERGRYAALKEGIVDVAVLSPPTDTDAIRSGYRVLSRFHEHFKLPFTGVGTNLKRLKENPDEVKRMVKAMLRANRFVRSNREGTIQTLMDWVKVDRESAAATYDSTWKIFSEDGGMSESGLKAGHRSRPRGDEDRARRWRTRKSRTSRSFVTCRTSWGSSPNHK